MVKFKVGDRVRFMSEQIKRYHYLYGGELTVIEINDRLEHTILRTRRADGRSVPGYYAYRFEKIEQDGPW